MEGITLNLVNFALDMHMTKQSVASQNIANVDLKNRVDVDFSDYLNGIEALDGDRKLEYLLRLNSQKQSQLEGVLRHTNEAIDIDQEHAESTKAMLEYQALVEALNRKMGLMALVLGGRK
jgi:flagellar basal-body rod protein FlgB